MIKYKNGNLFDHLTDQEIFLVHITNNSDQMGSGFVVPLFTKWPKVKQEYHKQKSLQKLGCNQYIRVEENITVVNMCAQDNLTRGLKKRCKYGYLAECLLGVRDFIDQHFQSTPEIYLPEIGSGIGGGDKEVIKEIIENIFDGYPVTMFIFNPVSVRARLDPEDDQVWSEFDPSQSELD